MYSLLLSVLGILFLMHWAIYRFFITVFEIKSKNIKLIVVFSLLFLAVSFVSSTLLVHWYENIVTKSYYFLSGLWLGFVINLLLAAGCFVLVKFIFHFFNKNMNPLLFGGFFVLLAIIYTGIGVFNAVSPKIKNISVEIKNLPVEWSGKKIVQISDVHLGRILGVKFLEKIINKIDEINPEMVVITGDLFDGMDGGLEQFILPLNKMSALKGVFYVTGNHDIYLGLEKSLDALKQTKIAVLDDEVVNIDGLQIIGVSYPVSGEKKDIEDKIKGDSNFSLEKPSILLFHSPINIFSNHNNARDWHNSMYFYPDVNFQVAKNLGADLQLSGHTHKGQFFPFNLITHFIFGGYDYGLHKDGDFSVFTSSGVGVWGPTMRTWSRSEIVVVTLIGK